MVLYTDGVSKSGWGFVAYRSGRVVAKRSAAFVVTTSSMCTEIETVTAAVR